MAAEHIGGNEEFITFNGQTYRENSDGSLEIFIPRDEIAGTSETVRPAKYSIDIKIEGTVGSLDEFLAIQGMTSARRSDRQVDYLARSAFPEDPKSPRQSNHGEVPTLDLSSWSLGNSDDYEPVLPANTAPTPLLIDVQTVKPESKIRKLMKSRVGIFVLSGLGVAVITGGPFIQLAHAGQSAVESSSEVCTPLLLGIPNIGCSIIEGGGSVSDALSPANIGNFFPEKKDE